MGGVPRKEAEITEKNFGFREIKNDSNEQKSSNIG